jgi:hypothetical protein
MRSPVYNAAIPKMVNRSLRLAPGFRLALQILSLIPVLAIAVNAVDWSGPEQQLARKVVAVTGPGAVNLTLENRSSLGRRDSEVIGNGLRAALEAVGLRFVKPEEAAASVAITLSENPRSYVWVAQIRQGTGEAAIVMVSAPRAEGPAAPRDSVPLSLRKVPLWAQEERILDVAVLEESVAPTRIAVLDAEKVSLYRSQGGKWQQEQTLAVTHSRPWSRDLRGRLIAAKDHLFDVHLPGVFCRSTTNLPLSLSCRESDDPWPLVVGSLVSGASSASGPSTNFPSFGGSAATQISIAQMNGFFAPTRNFFTGALASGVGKFTTVAKFYSAAPLPRDKYVLWLFASTDGQVHMVDGFTDLTAKLGWGADIASVRTSCGAGWQVLATSASGQAEDSIRAYEFPDRDPVPVSAGVDFAGEVTALWTEVKGDTAVAIARNRETGNYESFRLAVACNQ